jgi:hypothetical protein
MINLVNWVDKWVIHDNKAVTGILHVTTDSLIQSLDSMKKCIYFELSLYCGLGNTSFVTEIR